MALVDARAGTAPIEGPSYQHVRRRLTSGSARWAVASQSIIVVSLLALFVFFLNQDLPQPYAAGLVALLAVFAFTRVMAVWNLSFVFSDAGLEIYTSVQHHWLGWRDVTAISEWEIRRQNLPTMLLAGRRPFRVLRVHRRRRPPITVRASRGIAPDDLATLRRLALRNGVEWIVGDDFTKHAREQGVFALRSR